MGTDIHGWVEIKDEWPDEWIGVANIEPLLGRNYDMFACLFGVTNYANFRPIAPERGIPTDASLNLTRDVLEWPDAVFPTWITWDEIQAVHWNEVGTKPDERVHRYVKQADGQLHFVVKGTHPNSQTLNFEEENSWEADGVIYKIEKISRADVLESDPYWRFLFHMMDFLANQYPKRLVRLVVWFDQ